MNSMKFVILLHFTSWEKTPDDAVTPQRQSQFTPKMKANAEPRLLSSLVRIDSGVVVSQHHLESFLMKWNVTEWQVSWNSCIKQPPALTSQFSSFPCLNCVSNMMSSIWNLIENVIYYFHSTFLFKDRKFDVACMINGILSSLVSVTGEFFDAQGP